MRHGLLVCTQDPPTGERIAERWQQLLDLAPLAERSGFTSIHFPEHHARQDGYLPQPLVACAALAARTRTIRVGTAITVGPLRHPLHLAEEAAVVDVLSGGRLDLAVGIGNFQPEYDLFGVPYGGRGRRFDAFMDALLAALEGEAARPRPVQRPRPPVWLGAMSRAGVERAARLRLPLLLDPLNTIADLEPLAAHYRTHAGEAARVILMRWGWVGEAGDPEAVWWPHVRSALWGYLVDIPRLERANVGGAAAPVELRMSEVARDRLLVGSAAEVLARAREWCDRLGAERLIVKLQGDTGPWDDELVAAVAAYGEHVIGASDAHPR